MSDIILESVRSLVVAIIFLYIWRAGRLHRDLARRGWSLILLGFGLMFLGTAFDITDNFESLNRFVIIGDTEPEAMIEKLAGHLGGTLFLAAGLLIWIPTVTGVERIERMNAKLSDLGTTLAAANAELEVHRSLLESQNAKLTNALRTDRLTGVMSRAAWEAAADKEKRRCRRTGGAFGLIVLDIDRFKQYNDAAGHLAGDECLVSVARCIQATGRTTDSVGRFGGEEFVVLAPDTTSHKAEVLAERIRANVAKLKMDHPGLAGEKVVTVSVGVASGSSESWENVFRSADQAMYEAKDAGRNAVRSSRPNIAA